MGGGGPQGRPPQAAVGGRRPPNPGEAGVPCGPEPAGCINRPEGRKSDPVMGRSFGAGENYSATTMGASGAFLRTLSMPLRQLALAL